MNVSGRVESAGSATRGWCVSNSCKTFAGREHIGSPKPSHEENTRAEVESCEDEDLFDSFLHSRLLLAIWKIEESLDGYCTVVKKLGLAGSGGRSRPEKVLALERLGLARVTDESSPDRVS